MNTTDKKNNTCTIKKIEEHGTIELECCGTDPYDYVDLSGMWYELKYNKVDLYCPNCGKKVVLK